MTSTADTAGMTPAELLAEARDVVEALDEHLDRYAGDAARSVNHIRAVHSSTTTITAAAEDDPSQLDTHHRAAHGAQIVAAHQALDAVQKAVDELSAEGTQTHG